jgi:hypothetical protein
MVNHCHSRIDQGNTELAPFTVGPAVRERNLAGGLRRVEDTSGGGAGDGFGVDMVCHVSVPVRYSGTDIAESMFMQDPQRRHGARMHGKCVDRPLRAPPQQRLWLPALPDAQHSRSDIVAVVEALHRAERNELFGESMRGRFSEPGRLGQRGQSEPLVGVSKSVQEGECAVEAPRPVSTGGINVVLVKWSVSDPTASRPIV